MASIPLTLSLAPFPTGSALTADEFGQQLIANISAVLNGNVLLGQSFGTMPPSNIGPWFNGSTWFIWNTVLGTYSPIPVREPYSSIHNASMQIWQRGNTFTTVTGNSYVADRFIATETLVTGVATISQQSLNILGTSTYPDTAHSLRITVTTAQATISANEVFVIYQRVELLNSRPLFDGPTSLSIVLQASVSGTYCVAIRDAGTDWSYVMECAVSAPGIPQAFTFPSIPTFPTSTGNWGTNETDACYSVTVTASCGATYQTPKNIWSAGNFVASSNQSNLFATVGNTLDITLIQHEPGLICNPFIFTQFDDDLRKCQRYYTKSFNYGTNPNEFALSTSASTASGNILTFTSTTGSATNSTVSNGMYVLAGNVTSGTTVSSVTATTVTLSAPVLGTITLGETVSFTAAPSQSNELTFLVYTTVIAFGNVRFPVKMRTTPTLILWSITYGQEACVFSQQNNLNVSGLTTPTLGDFGFDYIQTSSTWNAPTNAIRFHYTATADL
jgi:hypothetical protein